MCTCWTGNNILKCFLIFVFHLFGVYREKAAQFGLSQSFNASLDLNKSFPTTADVKYRKEDEAAKEQVCTLEKFKGKL